jgi:hypothetical protein
MATLATIFDWILARGSQQAAPRSRTLELEEPYAVPFFPNEDVYFYVKRIDNSGVAREMDPATHRVCWSLIGSTFAVAMLVMGLLLPTLYGLVAGYRIEALRHEKDRLDLERASLELQESRLMNPARLEELAKIQRFVDPAPQKVVRLEGKDSTLHASVTTGNPKR